MRRAAGFLAVSLLLLSLGALLVARLAGPIEMLAFVATLAVIGGLIYVRFPILLSRMLFALAAAPFWAPGAALAVGGFLLMVVITLAELLFPLALGSLMLELVGPVGALLQAVVLIVFFALWFRFRKAQRALVRKTWAAADRLWPIFNTAIP